MVRLDRYIEALKGAEKIRKAAYDSHNYECDFTVRTCVQLAMWQGLEPRRILDFSVSDSHW